MTPADLTWSDRLSVALLCTVMFTSGADMLVMTPILPRVAADLSVQVEVAGLLVTAYAVATACTALVFGPVSDRVGRKPILIAGITVLSVGTLACSFAPTFGTLIAARFVAGAGAGLLVTSTTSFIGDHFGATHRAVMMGYVMSGFFLSLIIAVPVGAYLASKFGWRNMFLVLTAAAAVVAMLLILLPRPRHEHRTTSLSVGGALGNYRALLLDRRVLGVLAMSLAIGSSMTMFSVYSSPWMEATFGLDTAHRGLVYAVGGPAVFMGGPLAGWLSNRLGRVRLVVAGSLLMAAMQIAMPSSPAAGRTLFSGLDASSFSRFGDGPWIFVAPTLLVFFLVLLAGSARSTPFQTFALEIVPPERRGAVSALRNAVNQVGSGTGAALGGALWASTKHPYSAVCYGAALITVAGITLLWSLSGSDAGSARVS